MKLTKPTVNDLVQDTVVALAKNFDRIDSAFSWVGMVIFSTRETNPAAIYGGTWQRLEGRVLVGAGTAFPAGETGGSAVTEVGASTWGMQRAVGMAASGEMYGVHEHGTGAAKSNMPPYRSVYMWERVA
ncbi:MAG: hypothetical protein RSB04_10795 [Gordonibacter sp.]|uniref:hypothetical protein n=1 Tax=Gordonibacter sp. TaxID=1968902 RepID=UPI002FC8C305